MARIRSIKPEFWTDEKVVELSAFARLLFIGLWNFADDEGRMVCSPKRIKMQIFPSDSVDCSALLGEIRGESLIELYVVDGQEYLQINGFTKHQKVDKRTPSKLPPPPDHHPESPRVVPTEGIKEGIKEGKGCISANADMSGTAAGLPDVQPLESEKPKNGTHYNPMAREVLGFLNAKTGRSYQPVDANLKLIVARLKEGASVADCRAVVAKKCREWASDEKMSDYLRPATLFNATKFAQYRGELVEVDDG